MSLTRLRLPVLALPLLAFLTGVAAATTPPVSFADCNGNGIEDAVDIAFGTSSDEDHNGVPDECEAAPARPGGVGEQ